MFWGSPTWAKHAKVASMLNMLPTIFVTKRTKYWIEATLFYAQRSSLLDIEQTTTLDPNNCMISTPLHCWHPWSSLLFQEECPTPEEWQVWCRFARSLTHTDTDDYLICPLGQWIVPIHHIVCSHGDMMEQLWIRCFTSATVCWKYILHTAGMGYFCLWSDGNSTLALQC